MKKSGDNPGVIVIGGHVQGLGIVRIFGESGIPSIVLDTTKNNLARHSKYVQKFISYPKNDLLNKLLELGDSAYYVNWLIIPTNDAQVEVISRNKNILNKFFKISTDDWSVIQKCYNKRLTYNIVARLGINFPKTWSPDSFTELEELSNIKFPCIIKPAVMHTFYSKLKKKVLLCNSFDELKLNYEKAINIIPSNEIIVQEIIPGSNENQYSVCFLFNQDSPLVTLVARRKRQHPLDFGNATTFAETVENKQLVEHATLLLKDIKYKGICEVEFKLDERDNQFKFLEINPRSWKWHTIAKKTESPFLISLYHLHYKSEPIVKNNWKPACFKHLLTDLPVIIKLILKSRYKKSKCNNIQYAVWDIKDLKPAFFELLYLPIFIFTR